jgi:hypothetical protein
MLKDLPSRSGWKNEGKEDMTDPADPFEKALYPAFEKVIKQDYANPNREGCPGQTFLEKAAISPSSLDPDERALLVQHVPKCWPCFKELKHLRETPQAHKPPQE